MKKNSKIYIAGHNGLVGSAIFRCLQLKGYCNLVLRSHDELDLMHQKKVDAFFLEEKPEYVFLAAAKVGGIWANKTYPAEFIYNNLAIQNNVIYSAHKHGAKAVLFLGSSCIYPKLAPQPIKEEYLLSGSLEPTNQPYAIAKIAGIELCESLTSIKGTKFLSVMPNNVYGPNDNYHLQDSHVLPALIRKFHLAKLAEQQDWEKILEDEKKYGKIPNDIMEGLRAKGGQNVQLWGSGSPMREFLYSEDLADACLFLINMIEDLYFEEINWPAGRHLINIGSGQEITIKRLAEKVARLVGYEGKVSWDKSKPDGTPRKLLDNSFLSKLGWSAKSNLNDGIQLTYKDYLGKLT